MQSGGESGGSSHFEIDSANEVDIDLILPLFERAKIIKMEHYTEEEFFEKTTWFNINTVLF